MDMLAKASAKVAVRVGEQYLLDENVIGASVTIEMIGPPLPSAEYLERVKAVRNAPGLLTLSAEELAYLFKELESEEFFTQPDLFEKQELENTICQMESIQRNYDGSKLKKSVRRLLRAELKHSLVTCSLRELVYLWTPQDISDAYELLNNPLRERVIRLMFERPDTEEVLSAVLGRVFGALQKAGSKTSVRLREMEELIRGTNNEGLLLKLDCAKSSL